MAKLLEQPFIVKGGNGCFYRVFENVCQGVGPRNHSCKCKVLQSELISFKTKYESLLNRYQQLERQQFDSIGIQTFISTLLAKIDVLQQQISNMRADIVPPTNLLPGEIKYLRDNNERMSVELMHKQNIIQDLQKRLDMLEQTDLIATRKENPILVVKSVDSISLKPKTAIPDYYKYDPAVGLVKVGTEPVRPVNSLDIHLQESKVEHLEMIERVKSYSASPASEQAMFKFSVVAIMIPSVVRKYVNLIQKEEHEAYFSGLSIDQRSESNPTQWPIKLATSSLHRQHKQPNIKISYIQPTGETSFTQRRDLFKSQFSIGIDKLQIDKTNAQKLRSAASVLMSPQERASEYYNHLQNGGLKKYNSSVSLPRVLSLRSQSQISTLKIGYDYEYFKIEAAKNKVLENRIQMNLPHI